MDKSKNLKIAMQSRDIEDFIWMSYRYCIGRKTIAASVHAGTIAELIFKNPNILTDDRKIFMAQDIRQCILDTIRWNKFIKIENHYNRVDWDVYSAILEASIECPFPNEVTYIVDMEKKVVTWKRFDIGTNNINEFDKFDDMYHELIPWVKLANALDKTCHKDVVVKLGDETRTIRCFPYTAYSEGKYKSVFASIEFDANSGISTQGYVIPENILQINDIQ